MTIQEVKIKLNTMFSGLQFESRRHLYYVEGENHISVSKKLEEFEHPFDEGKWLPLCAKKEKISEHELKHKWQTINKEACELGTETHDFLERYTGLETPKTPQQKAGIKFLRDYGQEYEIVSKELRMYSRKYKIAGTCDLLMRHKETGLLILPDYKTNKDIFKAYDFLKDPFSYLEAHPYNLYQLQLSFYQLMLEEINLSISKRLLVHLRADETYRVFETVDFTEYLSEYLQKQRIAA